MSLDLSEHRRRVNGRRIISREYSAWQMMKNRYLNRRCVDYGRYGALGFTFDPRWHEFENFLVDMGLKPAPDCSIRRYDNTLGFSPANCYWGPAKRKAQPKVTATYNVPEAFRKWVSR